MPLPYILFPPAGKIFLYDEKNYSCYEQSCKVERVLESWGFHVYGKSGYVGGRAILIINNTTGKVDYDILGDYEGHRWVSIELFGGLEIPFDATMMLPVSTAWFPVYHPPLSLSRRYQVIIKDEGAYDGYNKISRDNETLENIIIIQ